MITYANPSSVPVTMVNQRWANHVPMKADSSALTVIQGTTSQMGYVYVEPANAKMGSPPLASNVPRQVAYTAQNVTMAIY